MVNSHGELSDGRDVRDDYVAGITAAAVAASGDKVKSKALAVKEQAWQRQHEALQADRYRITLFPRVEGRKPWNIGRRDGQPEQLWTADQLTEKLGFLSKKNAEGYDVYLTPFKEGHFFLVVDDMTAENQKALLDNGFEPALIQESSENNRQAVLVVPGCEDDKEAANRVVAKVNRQYGDPNFHGHEHPFRMAGFSNKKEGRKSAFTRILSAAYRVCGMASKWLDAAKDAIFREQEQAKAERAAAVERTEKHIQGIEIECDGADPAIAFLQAKQKILQLVEAKGWVFDESRADYMAAKALFEKGFGMSAVVTGLLECPNIDRKSNPTAYAERTAEAARKSVVLSAGKNPETSTDKGFEQSEKPEVSVIKKRNSRGMEM